MLLGSKPFTVQKGILGYLRKHFRECRREGEVRLKILFIASREGMSEHPGGVTMDCPRCRDWVPDRANFCQTCGHQFAVQIVRAKGSRPCAATFQASGRRLRAKAARGGAPPHLRALFIHCRCGLCIGSESRQLINAMERDPRIEFRRCRPRLIIIRFQPGGPGLRTSSLQLF
jgi:hypothetical protein